MIGWLSRLRLWNMITWPSWLYNTMPLCRLMCIDRTNLLQDTIRRIVVAFFSECCLMLGFGLTDPFLFLSCFSAARTAVWNGGPTHRPSLWMWSASIATLAGTVTRVTANWLHFRWSEKWRRGMTSITNLVGINICLSAPSWPLVAVLVVDTVNNLEADQPSPVCLFQLSWPNTELDLSPVSKW